MILEVTDESAVRADPSDYVETFNFHICIGGCDNFCIGNCSCSSSHAADPTVPA